MRISDWSSDVCSSDLQCGACQPCHQCTPAEPEQGARGDIFADACGTGAALILCRFAHGRDLHKIKVIEQADPSDACNHMQPAKDRKSVVTGKRVSVRVDLGVRRLIKKKKTKKN